MGVFNFNTKAENVKPKIWAILNKWMGMNVPIFLSQTNRDFIDKGYMLNPDVYSVINLILKAVSGIPFEVYQVKDKKALTRSKSFDRFDVRHKINKYKALEKLDTSPLLDLLNNPNPMQGRDEFIENVLGFKLLTGNTYIALSRPENGRNKGLTKQMHALPAHLTEIITSGDIYSPIGGYQLSVYDRSIDFKPDEVIHMKYWNPDFSNSGAHLYGQSPLKSLTKVIQVSNDNYTANAKLLQNLGAVGILSGDSQSDYNPEQMAKLKEMYKQSYQGSEKWGDVILTSQKLTFQKMGQNVNELGLNESKKYNLRDICNAYGVNSALLNDPDNKVYANAKEARKGLYTEVVLPILDNFISELNRTLAKEYSKKLGVELIIGYNENTVPELQQDLSDLREKVKDIWELTPNQRLDVMGFEPNPSAEMDKIWMPMNLVPMESLDIDDLKPLNGDL